MSIHRGHSPSERQELARKVGLPERAADEILLIYGPVPARLAELQAQLLSTSGPTLPPAPPPPPPPPAGLTAADLDHCARFGLDPLAYLAARQGQRMDVHVGAMLGIDPQALEAERLRQRVATLEDRTSTVANSTPVVNVRAVGLTDAELELCAAIGVTPEAYAEQRAKEAP